MVKLQYWIKAKGHRLVVVFDGRDAAGKGGVIKRITERVSPRVFRVVALPAPTDREKTQLYIQRYLPHFPPLEVAYLSHRIWAPKTNWRIDRFVYEQSLPQFVPPAATESGFVFTNLRKGAKYVPVDIFFERHIEGLEFFVSSTGFRADHTAVDFEVLWQEAQKTVLSTKAEVREWVESLPCCATNKTGSKTGDLVNFVIVTSDLAFRQGVMRTGWDG